MICIQRAPWHFLSNLVKPVVFLALSSALCAQFRGGSDWSTNGGDAHRSSWVAADPKINPKSVGAPGFQLLWKMKFDNRAEKSNSLSAPVLLDRYIGYRGFRTYAFIGGSGENAFALDSDLGRLEWQKHFPVNASSELCQLSRRYDSIFDAPCFDRVPVCQLGPLWDGWGVGGRQKSRTSRPAL